MKLELFQPNGKLPVNLFILKEDSNIGLEHVIMVFKKMGNFQCRTWEYPYHLELQRKYYTIIDRRK
jgi:hypothetical protein